MARITFDNLTSKAESLNKATDNRYAFSIEGAYGMWRLAASNGSLDVSGYMSKAALFDWMDAVLFGMSHATRAGYYANDQRYAAVS